MRAHARVECGGRVGLLGHGDLVGRLWSAALNVNDPRISEAHAMVSHRENGLWLLALRRPLYVQGQRTGAVQLVAGQQITLADGVCLTVHDVVLPSSVLAIEHASFGRRLLQGVISLCVDDGISVQPGYTSEASAWVWSDGAHWSISSATEQPQRLAAGRTVEVAGETLSVIEVPVGSAAAGATRPAQEVPLELACFYDTLRIRRGEEEFVIGGRPARIVGELVAMGGAARWETVARELWGDDPPMDVLRRNWDANMARLRQKLRQGGVHHDLVRSDRAGSYVLVLREGDRLEDYT